MAINVVINGKDYEFDKDYTIIQACESAGVEIPRFCYHKRLAIAGNCRMCLVDSGGAKPVASCSVNITDKMKIVTDNEKVKKARADVMELLLINHPLDCPICDQAGECDLQDQAMVYGRGTSPFHEDKRVVPEKDFGKFIKTYMTRCIHCMRCVRFMNDVAGIRELDVLNRGEDSEIISAIEGGLRSELSGNIIDLCPVGALTNRTYQFKARPWELKRTASIDIHDSICPDVFFDSLGNEILRVLPRENDGVNEEWISNKTRFAFDGLRYNRLMDPLLKVAPEGESPKNRYKRIGWDEALQLLCDKLLKSNPNKIAVLSGDLVDFGTLFQLKKFCEAFKIQNFDCRSTVSNLPNGFNYLFESGILGIEETDCILIIGCNIEEVSPVLNARIRRNISERGLKIGVLGGEFDLRYEYEFLGKSLSESNMESGFWSFLADAKKPMIILGDNLFSGNKNFVMKLLGFVKNLTDKFTSLNADWKFLNVLYKNVGIVNGLCAGFYNEGLKTFGETIGCRNDFEFLYLVGEDNFNISTSDADFIVYQGHHGNGNANFADLILPSLAFTEKNGIFYNIEGVPREARKAVNFPANAMSDIEILQRICGKLNISLGLKGVESRKMSFDIDFEQAENTIDEAEFSIDYSLRPNVIVRNSQNYA